MNYTLTRYSFACLYKVILFTGFFLSLAVIGSGQTNGDYRSRASGDWNGTSVWQVYNNNVWANTSNYPGQAAGAGNVLIQDGHTVSINATITNAIGSLSVGGGTSGTLQFYNSASAGNYILTVSGDIIVNAGSSFIVLNRSNYNDHTLNIGGNLTVNGTLDMTSLTDDKADVVLNGSTQQTIGGSGATCSFYDLTISNTSGVVLARNIELAPSPTYFTSPSLTVSANCSFDISTYTCNRSITGTGTLSLASGANLRIGGTNSFPSNYNTHSINGTSTVEYYGGNQGVAALNSSQNYGNLVLSGSGTKTFGGARTITNNLSIASGVMANLGTYTHTAGTLTLGGFGTPVGSWGSTSSSATHKNNSYFAATSGIVNVGTGTCGSVTFSTVGHDISCYGATDGSIDITVTSGNNGPYTYSLNNGTNYIGTLTGTHPNYSVTGLSAATHKVRIKDANGCESAACP